MIGISKPKKHTDKIGIVLNHFHITTLHKYRTIKTFSKKMKAHVGIQSTPTRLNLTTSTLHIII